MNAKSIERLALVNPKLAKVIRLGYTMPGISYEVTEGIRTLARQKELFAKGASHTMASNHLTGNAVDVVAMIGDEARWDWQLYPQIAHQIALAASRLGTPVVWGGFWGVITPETDLDASVAAYVARCKKQNRKALLDGPHFELAV
jgi:peptidoglycan L-alanyl-D-glutamate endopeptidase CwlK